MSKYDEVKIDYEKEYQRLLKEKSRLLCFIEHQEMAGKNAPIPSDMKKTYNYLQEIAIREDLQGATKREKNREILFKYFNNYQFESEYAVKSLIFAFLGEQPVFGLKYTEIWRLLKNLNKFYEFHAELSDDLVMTIKDEVVYEIKPVEDYFR